MDPWGDCRVGATKASGTALGGWAQGVLVAGHRGLQARRGPWASARQPPQRSSPRRWLCFGCALCLRLCLVPSHSFQHLLVSTPHPHVTLTLPQLAPAQVPSVGTPTACRRIQHSFQVTHCPQKGSVALVHLCFSCFRFRTVSHRWSFFRAGQAALQGPVEQFGAR